MEDKTASEQIDDIIKMLGGWKAEALAAIREVVTASYPNMVEEVKWKMKSRPEGLPVWTHNGIVCFAEIWKDNIKLIFVKGAQLDDPDKLLNSRLQSSAILAIEFREGDEADETALRSLVLEAVKLNTAKSK